MSTRTILIVEDERNIREALQYNLAHAGFRTLLASDGLAALELAQRELPDLILADWMLPEMDGLELCRTLKHDARTRAIPVMMLTVRSDETDKVLGLEMGADDYMTKPFSPRELVARIKGLLRRSSMALAAEEVFTLDRVTADWGRHVVLLNGKAVALTTKEFELLRALADAKGRVLSRAVLLARVWGYDRPLEQRTHTIAFHISQLRKKLPPLAKRIVTIRHAGYRLAVDD